MGQPGRNPLCPLSLSSPPKPATHLSCSLSLSFSSTWKGISQGEGIWRGSRTVRAHPRTLRELLHHVPSAVRRFFSAATSKLTKANASKRQRRYDDLNDEDYAPNQSDLAAESSAAEDSDESMEGAHGSDDDEVIDVQSMNQLGRR